MFLEEKQGNGWIINYINEFLKIRGYNVKNGGNKWYKVINKICIKLEVSKNWFLVIFLCNFLKNYTFSNLQ